MDPFITDFSKDVLIELGRKAHREFKTELPKIEDIRIAGSYCYNYHGPYSDIDVVIVCNFKYPLSYNQLIGSFLVEGKRVAYTLKDINNTKIPTWSRFTLPHLSLLNGDLFHYDKDSILEYIIHIGKYKKNYYIDKEYTDYYGSKINLQKQIEQIRNQIQNDTHLEHT